MRLKSNDTARKRKENLVHSLFIQVNIRSMKIDVSITNCDFANKQTKTNYFVDQIYQNTQIKPINFMSCTLFCDFRWLIDKLCSAVHTNKQMNTHSE